MPDIYKKRGLAGKEAQQDARREMQKKQMQIINEDGVLKRLVRDMEMKKKESETVRKNIEAKGIEILSLQRKLESVTKDAGVLERNVALQKAKIKKMEYDAEQYREKSYRRDKSEDF